jgi:hypothetical protein
MPCERIILHAGLHKSGTTSVQTAWLRWFADDPNVDYPRSPKGPGHPECAWGLMGRRGADPRTLQRFVAAADESAANLLVLSSEEFDSLDQQAWLRVRQELGAERVTLVITITQPAHRWYAMWQELVKHGHFGRPIDVPELVTDWALLNPASLERLIAGAGMDRTVVRIVRPHPPEASLPRDLARAVGIPVPADDDAPSVLNTGLGAFTELLRRTNAAGQTDGALTADSMATFAQMQNTSTRRDRVVASDAFRLPKGVLRAAQIELRYLKAASVDGRISLVDPHDGLSNWADPTPPTWIDEISTIDWDTPDASSEWPKRAAERIVELTRRTVSAEESIARLLQSQAALDAERDQLAAAHATLAADLQSIRTSLSWRLTRPLRAAKRIARRA